MRTYWAQALSILCIGWLGAACSSVRVVTEYNPKTNFGIYKSYKQLADQSTDWNDPRIKNPHLKEQLEAAIKEELLKKGLQVARETASDFNVVISVSSETKKDVTWERDYNRPDHGANPRRVTHIYKEGTLRLEFQDGQTGDVFWAATGTDRLSGKASEKQIKNAVRKVLDEYPPPSGD